MITYLERPLFCNPRGVYWTQLWLRFGNNVKNKIYWKPYVTFQIFGQLCSLDVYGHLHFVKVLSNTNDLKKIRFALNAFLTTTFFYHKTFFIFFCRICYYYDHGLQLMLFIFLFRSPILPQMGTTDGPWRHHGWPQGLSEVRHQCHHQRGSGQDSSKKWSRWGWYWSVSRFCFTLSLIIS
jgi:hypothetical protein